MFTTHYTLKKVLQSRFFMEKAVAEKRAEVNNGLQKEKIVKLTVYILHNAYNFIHYH